MIIDNNYSINIQEKDFSVNDIYNSLKNNQNTGACVHFIGLVRDFYFDDTNTKQSIHSIYLECYDDMAYKQISKIIEEALDIFKVNYISLVHRKGLIKANEQIVFIGVSSYHRKEAFKACEFVIDYLKVKAPFWKKEISKDSSSWVKQKASDKK